MAENLDQLALWQNELQSFDLEGGSEPSELLQDYLEFYGLDLAKNSEEIEHLIGYVDVGGRRLSLQYYRQASAREADLVFVQHGYTDHVGLFSHVINHLLAQGFSVAAYDLPGHGLSEGERATINSFEEYRSCLDEVMFFLKGELKAKCHIVAQSLGAALIMDWILMLEKNQKIIPVEKVVLFAPLVKPKGWGVGKVTYHAIKKLKTGIDRTYGPNSEDEVFLDFVKNKDPLQHDRLPTQWVGALDAWIDHFQALPDSDFPLYIIQGRRDMTVDWKYNITYIEHKFHNTMTHYVTDAGHHLANESERLRKDVFAYLEAAFH